MPYSTNFSASEDTPMEPTHTVLVSIEATDSRSSIISKGYSGFPAPRNVSQPCTKACCRDVPNDVPQRYII